LRETGGPAGDETSGSLPSRAEAFAFLKERLAERAPPFFREEMVEVTASASGAALACAPELEECFVVRRDELGGLVDDLERVASDAGPVLVTFERYELTSPPNETPGRYRRAAGSSYERVGVSVEDARLVAEFLRELAGLTKARLPFFQVSRADNPARPDDRAWRSAVWLRHDGTSVPLSNTSVVLACCSSRSPEFFDGLIDSVLIDPPDPSAPVPGMRDGVVTFVPWTYWNSEIRSADGATVLFDRHDRRPFEGASPLPDLPVFE
jgi:hypothetical protein